MFKFAGALAPKRLAKPKEKERPELLESQESIAHRQSPKQEKSQWENLEQKVPGFDLKRLIL